MALAAVVVLAAGDSAVWVGGLCLPGFDPETCAAGFCAEAAPMRKTWATIAAVALVVPGAVRAQAGPAQDFCSGLNRVVQVAQMDGDFSPLERSWAEPHHFGFRHGCRAHGATKSLPAVWWCHQSLAPQELSMESLAGRTQACLPNAVRTRGRYREAIFTLPRVRILIDESGGPGAHVGLSVTFRVEAVREAE